MSKEMRKHCSDRERIKIFKQHGLSEKDSDKAMHLIINYNFFDICALLRGLKKISKGTPESRIESK